MNAIFFILSIFFTAVSAFHIHYKSSRISKPQSIANVVKKTNSLKMVDQETLTYVGAFVLTFVPSLVFVKFVGDQADSSRDNISDETKEKFKRAMMEQPGQNWALPTSEEEQLKKQIAKAYMQDKDVDVAVLEEKLRKRAQWRKEMMAQARAEANSITEDEEGW